MNSEIRSLNRLFHICKAGERGFHTIASAVADQGMKVYLKELAKQRREMADELETLIRERGGEVKQRNSFLSRVHRGRITITSTLIMGKSNTRNAVLREALLGEKLARKTYMKSLADNWPTSIENLLRAHLDRIEATDSQIAQLIGHDEMPVEFHFLETTDSSLNPTEALVAAGLSPESNKAISIKRINAPYEGQSSLVNDALISGSVGGAMWGSVIGALSGIGILLIPNMEPIGASTLLGMWSLTALGGTISGLIIGAILGFIIGTGISEDDTHVYGQSVGLGNVLVMLDTTQKKTAQALQKMQASGAGRDTVEEDVLASHPTD